MKNAKKLLAVILAIFTSLSFASLAFAEGKSEIYPEYITEAKATQKDGDKVTQIELTFGALTDYDLSQYELVDFNKVNTEAVIEISFSLFTSNVVATLKPVKYENKVLTCNVFDENGKAGRKFVTFNDMGLSSLYYTFKDEDMLVYVDANNQITARAYSTGYLNITGVDQKNVLPKLVANTVEKVISALDDGNITGAITSALPVLFLLPVLLPIALGTVNSAYKVYGVRIGIGTIVDLVKDLL